MKMDGMLFVFFLFVDQVQTSEKHIDQQVDQDAKKKMIHGNHTKL
jgi:hypothetical protein